MFEMNALGTNDILADNIQYNHLHPYLQLLFEYIIYWQCVATSWLLINEDKLEIYIAMIEVNLQIQVIVFKNIKLSFEFPPRTLQKNIKHDMVLQH